MLDPPLEALHVTICDMLTGLSFFHLVRTAPGVLIARDRFLKPGLLFYRQLRIAKKRVQYNMNLGLIRYNVLYVLLSNGHCLGLAMSCFIFASCCSAAHAARRCAFPFARNAIFSTSGVCQSVPWKAADLWWGEAVRCLRTTNHLTRIKTIYIIIIIIKSVALPTPSLSAHKTSQYRGILMILTTLWRTTTEAISRACAESSWRNRGSDLCVSPLCFYAIEMASDPVARCDSCVLVDWPKVLLANRDVCQFDARKLNLHRHPD